MKGTKPLINHSAFGYANIHSLISISGFVLVFFILLHTVLKVWFLWTLFLGVCLFYLLSIFFIKEILVYSDYIIVRWLVYPYLKKKVFPVSCFKRVVFREGGPRVSHAIDIYYSNANNKESFYSFSISNKQYEKRERIAGDFMKLGAKVEL